MFCLKCGSQLPDDAKFCGVCGAPVNTVQENSPVCQRPAGTANEAESTQMPNPAPFMEAPQFNGQIGCGVVVPVQKKSKKGLIIGLSIGGGILLAAIVAVILFASGLFNPASYSPFPVLDTGKAQIYYGESFDSLERKFPDIKKAGDKSYNAYILEQSSNQILACLIREDKKTGEKKLVRWGTTVEHMGLTNGISIGDSYEKILEEYPDAMCSTEMESDNMRKYDPEKDLIERFKVYMDEKGNTYSPVEAQEKLDIIYENGTEEELTKWYVLDFIVASGQIIKIDFCDLQALLREE